MINDLILCEQKEQCWCDDNAIKRRHHPLEALFTCKIYHQCNVLSKLSYMYEIYTTQILLLKAFSNMLFRDKDHPILTQVYESTEDLNVWPFNKILHSYVWIMNLKTLSFHYFCCVTRKMWVSELEITTN